LFRVEKGRRTRWLLIDDVMGEPAPRQTNRHAETAKALANVVPLRRDKTDAPPAGDA
jgi:hypothetical protein